MNKKHGNRYDWATWFSKVEGGENVTLVKGKDYFCRTDSMAQMIRYTSRKAKVKCSVHIHDDEDKVTIKQRGKP